MRADASNNLFVGLDYAKSRFTMIPSGLDQTFKSCEWNLRMRPALEALGPSGGCKYMAQCFEDPECKELYDAELADALRRTDIRKVNSCLHETYPALVCAVIFIPLAVALCIWRRGERGGEEEESEEVPAEAASAFA